MTQAIAIAATAGRPRAVLKGSPAGGIVLFGLQLASAVIPAALAATVTALRDALKRRIAVGRAAGDGRCRRRDAVRRRS